jgi:hypothetical protein
MKKCEGRQARRQASKSDCEAKAVSKDGKPLAGAAKAAFDQEVRKGRQGQVIDPKRRPCAGVFFHVLRKPR